VVFNLAEFLDCVQSVESACWRVR